MDWSRFFWLDVDIVVGTSQVILVHTKLGFKLEEIHKTEVWF